MSGYAAYLTTSDGWGEKVLDVIPGAEGSGHAPILTVPITVPDDVTWPTEDIDAMLSANGWHTVVTPAEPGVTAQPGHWTATDFGWVAAVERVEG